MPLVPVTCANCGASLTLDEVTVGQLVECPYCHTSLTFERQPDNTFVTSYEIGHADTVIVQDSNSVENRLANAETYLNVHKRYDKACELFEGIIGDASGEWRAWWGYVRSRTEDFTFTDFTKEEFEGLSGRVRSALAVAPLEQRARIESEWGTYASRYGTDHENLRRALQETERDLTQAGSEVQASDERIEHFRQRINELEQREAQIKQAVNEKGRAAQTQEDNAKAPAFRGCFLVILGITIFNLATGAEFTGWVVALLVIFAIPPVAISMHHSSKRDGILAEAADLERQAAELERQRDEANRLLRDETTTRDRLVERRDALEGAKHDYASRL